MDGGAQDSGGEGAILRLYLALGIASGDVVAFVGAGGKSSAILSIAGELAEAGMTFITAPTTKMLVSEAEKLGTLVTSEDTGQLRTKAEQTLSDGASGVVVGSGLLSKNRVGGVEPGSITSLASLADVVLIEADGSRRRPIKGTADHEPALPDAATLVVAVGNVHALGTPVDEEHVHRPAIFSDLTGVGPGRSMSDASVITRELWRLGVRNVVLASLPTESPVRVWIP